MNSVISVKQLNLYVKSLLDGQPLLQSTVVTGEISNFKNHYASGHWYFTLKDKDAAVRCVMFRSNAAECDFIPCDGMQVVIVGRVSLYEKDGQYQLYAERMLAAGDGLAALKFEEIKARLEKEGLFNPENKRPIPAFPKKIAVVTSDTGAAVKDIISILGRRWPAAEIIMCPVAVQGGAAVASMLDALDRIYALGTADIIIIGRGGGSAEDLSQFNDETLARKIYESPVPVISAVGHETDFTIADFVADMRAPTPSAAAELAVPDSAELYERIQNGRLHLRSALTANYERSKARYLSAKASVFLINPLNEIVESRAERTDKAADLLISAFSSFLEKSAARLSENAARLDALSPLKVMSRGYAYVSKNGKTVKSVNDADNGDIINVRFNDGNADCKIIKKERLI